MPISLGLGNLMHRLKATSLLDASEEDIIEDLT